MRLEVLESRAASATKPPVLLLHGVSFSAATWRGNLLEYFSDHGHDTFALSFRGHGESAGRDRLASLSIDDYVEDVERVLDGMGSEVFLVAHSMGGAVAQKVLQTRRLPGAALIAPVPPWGMLRSGLRRFRADPLSMAKFMTVTVFPPLRRVASPPRGLFSPDVTREQVQLSLEHLQRESPRVMAQLTFNRLRIEPDRIETPLLLVGFELDGIVEPAEVERTARLYGAPCTIFARLGHGFMYESRWVEVAARVGQWLEARHATAQPGNG